MKVAAIVPALNEEANVGDVLKTLLASKDINEVVLVDGGSKDKTADIGTAMGAKVIKLATCNGKAEAMTAGVKNTDAEIIVFFDADLIGLTQEHISVLVEPMLSDKAAMVIGVRGRWGGLPGLIVKIDPLLAIGGERAMKRFIFEAMPEEFLRGFAVETGLNFYCYKNNLPISYAKLRGLDMVVKEKKWGFWNGLKSRLKMIKQIIRVRFLISTNKVKF